MLRQIRRVSSVISFLPVPPAVWALKRLFKPSLQTKITPAKIRQTLRPAELPHAISISCPAGQQTGTIPSGRAQPFWGPFFPSLPMPGLHSLGSSLRGSCWQAGLGETVKALPRLQGTSHPNQFLPSACPSSTPCADFTHTTGLPTSARDWLC